MGLEQADQQGRPIFGGFGGFWGVQGLGFMFFWGFGFWGLGGLGFRGLELRGFGLSGVGVLGLKKFRVGNTAVNPEA